MDERSTGDAMSAAHDHEHAGDHDHDAAVAGAAAMTVGGLLGIGSRSADSGT